MGTKEKKRKSLYEIFFKRFLDFTLSLIGIIVLSPVFLIVWICSKISIGGKAIFAQYSRCQADENQGV